MAVLSIFTAMRYFLFFSYRGTNYHGWQIQKNALGVQEVINNTLKTILKTPVQTIGSCRTDTGVHANEQVLHFDLDKKLNKSNLLYKLNSLLPKDIAVNNIKEVRADAHARFSVVQRQYIYQITKHKNPFLQDLAYYFRKDMDLGKMNSLNDFLIEWKDFQSFCRVKTDVNNFICNIHSLMWTADKDQVYFTVSANRFLRGMVRTMVGTMIEVGMGNCSKQNFIDVVHSRDRRKAGPAVPPHGLFLNTISYPDDIFIHN